MSPELSAHPTIYEQFRALSFDIPVQMILPPGSSQSLIEEIEKGKEGIARVISALKRIDSEHAKAFYPSDEEKVKAI